MIRTAGVVLAAAVAAMTFAPVFGFAALLPIVAVPALCIFGVLVGAGRFAAVREWRAVLAAVAGLLAVAETVLWPTTVAGIPTGGTVRGLGAGVTDSLRLTLESTWPARPDAAQVAFVPLMVVLAAVLGGELVQRDGLRLVALVPSLAILVLAQLSASLPVGPAVLAVVAYTVPAAAVLIGDMHIGQTGTALLGVAAAVAVAAVLVPAGPARYSLHAERSAPQADTLAVNPLDEIGFRLAAPASEVFRVRPSAGVDRWTIAVFDTFDGVTWTGTNTYRRFGTELPPGPAVTVPVRRSSADIAVSGLDGPWLPSQTWPASVTGATPLVAERAGTLLKPDGAHDTVYTLSWWQPSIDAASLADAAIDSSAPGGLDAVGTVPDAVTQLAGEALHELRPSVRAALVLEDYLRRNYRLAVGQQLPSGHGWSQLTDFLLTTHRGTSEQFATAYVALARLRGIPARLAVGFRNPARKDADGWTTVRSGDVLAWPEVAVEGVGWLPLDPAGAAATSAVGGSSLGAATEQARSALPPPETLRDPPVSRPKGSRSVDRRLGLSWPVLLGPAVVLAGWLLGVPAAWTARAWWRRRRGGIGTVVGAWHEARDRLRAHGVEVTPGMTVRNLGDVVTEPAVVAALGDLARVVDRALWSDRLMEMPAQDGAAAWAATRTVRKGLARRGVRARLRATFNLRALWSSPG